MFDSERSLQTHERSQHLERDLEPQHQWPQCCKRFSTPKHLNIHVRRVHTTERRYVCSLCGNAFKTASLLNGHRRLHTGRNYECPHCDKKYTRRPDLNVHLRTHTGELPFSCHLCGKSFHIRVRLTYHLQRHEGYKHRCQYCPAEYNARSKLKEHMFIHTGMPYRCEHCPGIEFHRRQRFVGHMLRSHNTHPSDEELAEMFAKNTGKAVRFKLAIPTQGYKNDEVRESDPSPKTIE